MAIFLGLISFASPFLSIPFLIYCFLKLKWFDKRYAFPFAMIYGSIAYSVNPTGEIDLVRYFEMIKQMEGQTLSAILLNDYQMLYTQDLLFYFISKTEDLHILPFLVTTFVYFVSFYVSFDVFERMELYKSKKAKQYQVLISFFSISLIWTLDVISNVRNILAFMMIAFACYREFVEKKKGIVTWALYIFPLGLHTSAIVLLLLRILVPVIKKSKLLLMGAILFPVMVEAIHQLLMRINSNNILIVLLKNMVNKAVYYLNWNSGGWADVVNNNLLGRLVRVYVAIVLICFIFLLMHVVPKTNGAFKGMDSFLYSVVVMTLGCLYITTGALWRFEAVSVFLSAVMTAPAIKYGDKKTHLILTFLFTSSFLYFMYCSARFLRYVYVDELINGVVLFSGIKIIVGFFVAFFNIM